MMWLHAVVLSTCISVAWSLNATFPPGFKFGAATAAYQIEGGWNASDKGESVWDRTFHTHPKMAYDGSNGDVACDSYHKWREDVQLAHNLGLHFYRFSISWTRLLPQGYPNKVSKDGSRYYSNLIDGLLEKGIEPVITLYHWDLPQRFQDLGGWTNPLISDWFADYARVVYSLYADRVKTWITVNEPNVMCDFNYNTGMMPPLVKDISATYLCNKHVLVAHAKAWRVYHEEYKPKYHGRMSIGNHLMWMQPKTEFDLNATELALQHNIGRYCHPIYSKEGGWPPSVERKMMEYSKRQGYLKSILPKFTKEEIYLIKGTSDFFSINYYTARLVRWARPGDKPGIWFVTGAPELNLILESDPKWPTDGHSFTPAYAKGLRKIISWVRKEYGDLEIVVNENGYSNHDSGLRDSSRIQFVHDHLEQVLLAIEDGANVTMYSLWSLMDNMEWNAGFQLKFGIHQVDFNDPKRKRTPRMSAEYYSHVIKYRSLAEPFISKLQVTKQTNSARKSVDDMFLIIMLISLNCRLVL